MESFCTEYRNGSSPEKPSTEKSTATVGTVFQIQRFSIHDGPGIRTTVFLKGCPMRCLWCHNPESMKPETELGYRRNRCVGCGQCVLACPQGALTVCKEGIRRDGALCQVCLACTAACPTGAMEAYGRRMTPAEAADAVRLDKRYYDKTGGGATFSGGEPLSQPEFVRETAELLRREGIRTAIETSLYAAPHALEEVAPICDYIMTDIKVMDDAVHQKVTGCSNRRILANLVRLARYPVPVLIRIPVVPGINDSAQNAEQTARFLFENTPYRKIELLPMHKLATHKYEALGLDYPAQDIPLPTEEAVRQMARTLRTMGMEVLEK